MKNQILVVFLVIIWCQSIASEISSVSVFRAQSNLSHVENLSDELFVPITNGEINMGYTKDIIWMKVLLNSNENYDSKLLHFTKSIHDSLTVFYKKNGKWKELHTGISTNDSLYTFYSGYYFPLEHFQSNRPIYIRSRSVYGQDLNFHIVEKEDLYSNESQRKMIYGLLIGSILIIVFYNVFLGISIKDVTYFYYSLTGISSLLGQLTLLGVFNHYGLIYMMERRSVLLLVCITSVKIVGSIFIINFLKLTKYSNTAHKIVLVVASFNLLQLIVCLLLNAIGINVIYASGAIGGVLFVISALYAGIVALQNGNKNAKYYLIAQTLILLSVAVVGLKGLGVIPSNIFTNNFFWMASILETFLLSLALAARYKQWQKEKVDTQKKLDFQQMDMDRIAIDNVKRIEFKDNLIDNLRKISKNDTNLKSAIQTLIFDYEQLLSTENKQDFLNSNANEINAEFENKLNSKYPSLTKSEIKICGYVLIGLTNNEIAIIRNSNSIAVKSAQYRIRKKMKLEKDQTISNALKFLKNMDA